MHLAPVRELPQITPVRLDDQKACQQRLDFLKNTLDRNSSVELFLNEKRSGLFGLGIQGEQVQLHNLKISAHDRGFSISMLTAYTDHRGEVQINHELIEVTRKGKVIQFPAFGGKPDFIEGATGSNFESIIANSDRIQKRQAPTSDIEESRSELRDGVDSRSTALKGVAEKREERLNPNLDSVSLPRIEDVLDPSDPIVAALLRSRDAINTNAEAAGTDIIRDAQRDALEGMNTLRGHLDPHARADTLKGIERIYMAEAPTAVPGSDDPELGDMTKPLTADQLREYERLGEKYEIDGVAAAARLLKATTKKDE